MFDLDLRTNSQPSSSPLSIAYFNIASIWRLQLQSVGQTWSLSFFWWLEVFCGNRDNRFNAANEIYFIEKSTLVLSYKNEPPKI